MMRREAVAEALYKAEYNAFNFEGSPAVIRARFFCLADAALEAADSFGAAAEPEPDFVDDEPVELPDFYELQGLK